MDPHSCLFSLSSDDFLDWPELIEADVVQYFETLGWNEVSKKKPFTFLSLLALKSLLTKASMSFLHL